MREVDLWIDELVAGVELKVGGKLGVPGPPKTGAAGGWGVSELGTGVERKVGDTLGVPGPPKRGAEVELFGVHPVEFAIEERPRTVRRQPRYRICSDLPD